VLVAAAASARTLRYAVAHVLAARGLCKRFGARLVVDHVDLEVRRGDVYGFLGPNGAGKTTTLRMLLGLIRPTAGAIELFGQPFSPRRRDLLAKVGAIVEAPSFYRDMTGRQNLRMLASLTGPCPPARIDEVLELVELRDAPTSGPASTRTA
jgi:ABC-type multidrug transport system ATPase subunit